jgi:hypothetical protein
MLVVEKDADVKVKNELRQRVPVIGGVPPHASGQS